MKEKYGKGAYWDCLKRRDLYLIVKSKKEKININNENTVGLLV